jgi:hypothetical protein
VVSVAQVSSPKPCTAKVKQNFGLKNLVVRDHSRESVNLPKTDREMDKYQILRAVRDAFFLSFFLCGTGRGGGSFYLLDLAKTKRVKK